MTQTSFLTPTPQGEIICGGELEENEVVSCPKCGHKLQWSFSAPTNTVDLVWDRNGLIAPDPEELAERVSYLTRLGDNATTNSCWECGTRYWIRGDRLVERSY